MPEFRIKEGLSLGIRKDSRQDRNSQALLDMTNLIPTEWGAKTVPRSIPLPNSGTDYPDLDPLTDWPFPMVLHGEGNVLLCDRNAIYDGTGTSPIGLVGGFSLSATGNTTWEMAAFEENIWFLANGKYLVYKIPSNLSGDAAVIDDWFPQSIANFKGRLVLGGLTNSIPSKLTGFFDEWKEMDHIMTRTIGENETVNNSWLVYSSFGGGARDIPFFDFMSMLDDYGGHTISADLKTDMNVVIRAALEDGSFGFFPIRNRGDIRSIMPVGDLLMVYTSNGVSRIRMTEAGFVEEDVSDIGVSARCQVGGDINEHIYIDRATNINRVDANGNVERLGYADHGIFLAGSGLCISVDPLERFYSLSDGTYGYMLTRTGFCKTPCMMPTSLWRSHGVLYGPTIETTGTAATIETDIFDGDFRGVHEITHVRIASTDTTGWTVTPKWRLNKNDAFTSEAAVAFDDRGDARIKVFGIEFKLLLTAPNRSLADLERIEIEMRQGGKKKLRQLL